MPNEVGSCQYVWPYRWQKFWRSGQLGWRRQAQVVMPKEGA
jgi:hypothetical protein